MRKWWWHGENYNGLGKCVDVGDRGISQSIQQLRVMGTWGMKKIKTNDRLSKCCLHPPPNHNAQRDPLAACLPRPKCWIYESLNEYLREGGFTSCCGGFKCFQSSVCWDEMTLNIYDFFLICREPCKLCGTQHETQQCDRWQIVWNTRLIFVKVKTRLLM